MTAHPPPVIRAMGATDLDAVVALAAECPEAPQWPKGSWTAYLEDSDSSLVRTGVVAVGENGVLGFACATLLLDAQQASGQSGLCELDSMAVDRTARRRGIGAALLQEVFTWAVARGASRLVLEVRASNATALRLYRRFGLVEEGRRPRYYTDPEEDALLLGTTVTLQ